MSKTTQACQPLSNNSEPWLNALLTEYEIAQFLSVSVASVRRWRLLKQGPKYIKIGASVRYRPQDVSTYLESLPTGGSCIEERR